MFPTKIEIQFSVAPETLSVAKELIKALQVVAVVQTAKTNPSVLDDMRVGKTSTVATTETPSETPAAEQPKAAPKKAAKPKAPKPEVVAPAPTVIPAPEPDAPEAPPVVVAKIEPTAEVVSRDEMLLKIGTAGAQLAKQGKGTECRALFTKYGVASLAEVPDERLGEFAADIRALGGDV